MKKDKLPKLKKKVKDFLSSEEGKITRKQAAQISTFLLMAGTATGHALGSEHAVGGENLEGLEVTAAGHCSHG